MGEDSAPSNTGSRTNVLLGCFFFSCWTLHCMVRPSEHRSLLLLLLLRGVPPVRMARCLVVLGSTHATPISGTKDRTYYYIEWFVCVRTEEDASVACVCRCPGWLYVHGIVFGFELSVWSQQPCMCCSCKRALLGTCVVLHGFPSPSFCLAPGSLTLLLRVC